MLHIDEPYPQPNPLAWEEYRYSIKGIEELIQPITPPPKDFLTVLASRRSQIGDSVNISNIAELLYYSNRTLSEDGLGRAGLPIEHRASPSAGALHAINILCITDEPDAPIRVYNARQHSFLILKTSETEVYAENFAAISNVIPTCKGVTLRFISDTAKYAAAYKNPESLILRDAGCLLATISLTAHWLGLKANPLGFLGNELVSHIGLPRSRFMGVGGIQVSI